MDGTLIESRLDFAAIRADLGIDAADGIIEGLDKMSSPRRGVAHAKLLEYELAAVQDAPLMPQAVEIISLLRAAGCKTALLTRNTRRAVDIVLRRFDGLRFDLVRCREDGVIKPEPDGVLHACEQLDIAPTRTVCVGDFHYDIIAANAAGALSVAIVSDPSPAWADEADLVIRRLDELKGIMGL